MKLKSNYAFNPIAEQALRSNQTIVPQRVNAALDFSAHHSEAEVLLESVEVAVTVEEKQVALNAPRCDENVNGLPHGNPVEAQGTEITRCLDGNLSSAYVNLMQGEENILGLVEVTLGVEALQDFRQHEVPHGNGFGGEEGVEEVGLFVPGASEVVNPHARVHEDHLSVLIFSRSPSQVMVPRRRRMSLCC